jgi:hypothetical protein
MKYSLKSLMIVVTLVCVLLGGRIEYQRRWALYHEHQAFMWASNGEAFANGRDYHDSRASLYRQAMWRPWTVIDERPGTDPPTGPLKFVRDLTWITLLAAVGIAWWFDRRGLKRQIKALKNLPNSSAPAPNPPKP